MTHAIHGGALHQILQKPVTVCGHREQVGAFGVDGLCELRGWIAHQQTSFDGETLRLQLIAQALSIVVVSAYSGVATFVLLAVIKATIGLRVDARVEYHGLDLALHGETAVEYDREVYAQKYSKEIPVFSPVEKKQAKAA